MVLSVLVLFDNQNAGPYFSFLTFLLASALKRATFYYMNIQIF